MRTWVTPLLAGAGLSLLAWAAPEAAHAKIIYPESYASASESFGSASIKVWREGSDLPERRLRFEGKVTDKAKDGACTYAVVRSTNVVGRYQTLRTEICGKNKEKTISDSFSFGQGEGVRRMEMKVCRNDDKGLDNCSNWRMTQAPRGNLDRIDRLMSMSLSKFLAERDQAEGSYDWTDDGCSAPSSLPSAKTWSKRFRKACLRHDFGYRNWGRHLGQALDSNKDRTDSQFSADMQKICAENDWNLCGTARRAFYEAVRNLGKNAFYWSGSGGDKDGDGVWDDSGSRSPREEDGTGEPTTPDPTDPGAGTPPPTTQPDPTVPGNPTPAPPPVSPPPAKDVTAPVITALSVPAKVKDAYVGFSIAASDNVGVTQMRAKDTNGDWSEWTAFSGSGSRAVGLPYGLHTVWLQVRDGAGNVSSPAGANTTKVAVLNLGLTQPNKSDCGGPDKACAYSAGQTQTLRVSVGPVQPDAWITVKQWERVGSSWVDRGVLAYGRITGPTYNFNANKSSGLWKFQASVGETDLTWAEAVSPVTYLKRV